MKITADTNLIFQQLSNDQYRQTLDGLLRDFTTYNQVDDAFWFARNLEAALSSHRDVVTRQPNAFAPYQHMIIAADWVALSHLTEPKVVRMFHDSLSVGLTLEDYDLMSKVKLNILAIPTPDQRDEYKMQLRRSMETNDERLTNESLEVSGQMMSPTIGHWILLYNSRVGTQPVATVAFSEFLFSNKNVTQLSPTARATVEKLLRLYEQLKLSSQTPEGIENTIAVDEPDRLGNIVAGRFQPVRFDMNEVRQLNEIIARATGTIPPTSVAVPSPTTSVTPPVIPSRPPAQPPAAPTVDDALAQAENMLTTETNGDISLLQSALSVAIKTNKRERIVAALLILARLGALPELLMKNGDLAAYYEQNVIPALTKQLSIDATKVTKTYTPAHLREFLRFVLTNAVGSEAEAARYGAQIEAVMRSAGTSEYANMTYFEPRDGGYRWAQAQADEQGNLQ